MLIGLLSLQISGFGTFVAAGNFLTREEVGLVGALLTVVFWVDVLLDLGMGASLIYEQESGQSERVRVAFTVNSVVAVIVSIVVFVTAPAIAGFFQAESDVDLFRMVALLVLAKGLNQVPGALLRRDLRFKVAVFTDLTRSIGRFTLAITLLSMGWKAEALIVSVVVSEWAGVVLTWIFVRFRPRWKFDRLIAADMLKFGAAVFGSRLVGMLWLNGDYLVIGNRLGGKSKAYGDYYTAFRLPELVLGGVYNVFSGVSFPMYSAARELGPDKLRGAAYKSLKLLCLFGFTAGAGMALIARDFILTVWDEGSSGAIRPMELLCVAGAFVAVGYASGDIFNAIGKPRIGLYLNLAGTPILIGGFLAVVSHGIVAVALVHLCVIVPYSVVRLEVANRLIGTTWSGSLRALRPAFCAAAGVVALALPFRLLVGSGFLTGLTITALGAVGAMAGLAIGDRATFGELHGLGRKAIGR